MSLFDLLPHAGMALGDLGTDTRRHFRGVIAVDRYLAGDDHLIGQYLSPHLLGKNSHLLALLHTHGWNAALFFLMLFFSKNRGSAQQAENEEAVQ